jgi:hypothetical protein
MSLFALKQEIPLTASITARYSGESSPYDQLALSTVFCLQKGGTFLTLRFQQKQ